MQSTLRNWGAFFLTKRKKRIQRIILTFAEANKT